MISLLYFYYICNEAALLRVQFLGIVLMDGLEVGSRTFQLPASSAGRQHCLEPNANKVEFVRLLSLLCQHAYIC